MQPGNCSPSRLDASRQVHAMAGLDNAEKRKSHSPRLGIPRRSSRHKMGTAERMKMPNTPRDAMATEARHVWGVNPAPSVYALPGRWNGTLPEGARSGRPQEGLQASCELSLWPCLSTSALPVSRDVHQSVGPRPEGTRDTLGLRVLRSV